MGSLIPLPSLSPDCSPEQPEALPLGSIRPRLWTRPLRKLTPRTSYGYAVIHFAAVVLGKPLDPWQQWLVIHLGELLEDGRPRFRQVLVLVARQNGKTHLCMVLTLFWLFVEKWPLVFGTSTNLEQAAEPWEAACEIAEGTPALAAQLPRQAVRKANGQQTLTTSYRTKYKIGAVSPRGGRGKSIDRIVGDELREHRSWVGYRAAFNAMNARPHGQAVYITNQGDDGSVVLNALYKDALDGTDDRLGFFEWSAPPGCHPMDADGWAAANPQLGRRMDYDTIRGPAMRVSKPGADPEDLAGFRTEMLCQAVPKLNPAINPESWANLEHVASIDTSDRTALAACIDVSPDLQHATLGVAQLEQDGRVRVETVHEWSGADAVARVREDLPGWVRLIRPRALGWFQGGPAATLDAEIRDRTKKGRHVWPPRGVQVLELQNDTPAVCMAFSSLVDAGQIVHSGQAMLTAQVEAAEKLPVGDRWIMTRKGDGYVDAVYAVAGAAHLVRTLPTSLGRPRILVPGATRTG